MNYTDQEIKIVRYYEQGEIAYRNGVARDENPHGAGDQENILWRLGYDSAHLQDNRDG